MAIFDFDQSYMLGKVRAVDTRKVTLQVTKDENLRKARVGYLVALVLPGVVEEWLIGIIDKVVKIPVAEILHSENIDDSETIQAIGESILNTAYLTLVGTITTAIDNNVCFSRSLVQVPEIDTPCFILRDAQLQKFMNVLSTNSKTEHSLSLGKYTIDDSAEAFIDGNKFFQRHAAILGSTGSGKSCTIASILEKSAKLPSSNIIVFDLHGEYGNGSYARQLRIPGPEDLGKSGDDLLYLSYWLLNTEELQTMFTDKSEFSAHNQVMIFQDSVIDDKKRFLETNKKADVLKAFTLDSPIPFSLGNIIKNIEARNIEMVPGSKSGSEKQGPFFGQFTRLLARMQSKVTDRRYGFLFQAPDSEHTYEALANIAKKLLNCSGDKNKIKIIDFSDVPSDILPIMVGIVARLIFQLQFWTPEMDRKPVALVCDEAHLYLPKKEGKNPVEQRAVENFERIAKEGRKYGLSLVIVSQRPSDVSTTILSQSNNIISLRLTNSDDQSTVKKYMPESFEGLLDTLPMLDTGEALVVGDSVLLPSRIKITMPTEKPKSATIDFWTEWCKEPKDVDYVKVTENMRKQSRSL